MTNIGSLDPGCWEANHLEFSHLKVSLHYGSTTTGATAVAGGVDSTMGHQFALITNCLICVKYLYYAAMQIWMCIYIHVSNIRICLQICCWVAGDWMDLLPM